METIVEHRPTIAGQKTRVLELDGEGPRLIMLHGFADSADCWRPLLDRMRRTGRAAVALDQPGFGQAARLERETTILPQLDAFAAGAIERFDDGDGVLVIGNSLGGCVAIRTAQEQNPAVVGCVAISPAGLEHAPWLRIIERAPLVRAMLGSPVPVPEAVVRDSVGRLYRLFAFSNSRTADKRQVAAFASHISNRRDARRILATGQRIYPELLDAFELDQIECPLMVIWGDRDRMVYSSGAERVIAEAQDARLELIEGCGHCPQVEAPNRTAELIDEFCAEVAPAVIGR